MKMNGNSDMAEAQSLLSAGASNARLIEMLEGVTKTLRGIKHGPSGWHVVPQFSHIVGAVEPGLAHARLERSQRILRLACAARGIEVS